MSTTPSAMSTVPTRSSMHTTIWIIQGLLAAAFLMVGSMKLTAPLAQLQAQMPWVSGALGGLVRFIGAVEILGAVGLILPAATRIKPGLTPLAAAGLATTMVLASITHAARGEFAVMPVPLTLGAMALFIVWGRTSRAPIAPRA